MRHRQLTVFTVGLLAISLLRPAIGADQCIFHRRPFQAGEISNQTVRCDLSLQMAVLQGNQTVDSSQQAVRREQKRQIKIVSVGENAPQKAVVSYQQSAISVQQSDAEPVKSDQPVSGKSYYVSRENGKLNITTLSGATPPPAELALLEANLEAFGLPNPIANYFDGRTMHIGEKVDLPVEVARELLGFQETVGNISNLSMTLAKILETKSGQVAIFDTHLTAKHSTDGVSITLKGQLAIETDSCRTAAVNLAGPVAVNEVRGPENGRFEINSRGELRVAVRATYTTRKK